MQPNIKITGCHNGNPHVAGLEERPMVWIDGSLDDLDVLANNRGLELIRMDANDPLHVNRGYTHYVRSAWPGDVGVRGIIMLLLEGDSRMIVDIDWVLDLTV